jgi:hypothetical protein
MQFSGFFNSNPQTEWKNLQLCMLSSRTQVCEITSKASISTIIGPPWVFACKDDVCYMARCVPKGFSQILGKDFQDNHAPVIVDTSLHLLMVCPGCSICHL